MFSFVDDTVLDPFLGTGSTVVAAAKAERNSIGNELDPEYFRLAEKRIREAISQRSMLGEAEPTLIVEAGASKTARRKTG